MIVGERFYRSGFYFILPLLIFLIFTTLLPLMYVVIMSFFRNYLPEKNISFIFLNNFVTVFKDQEFIKSILQTLKYVFSCTILHLSLALFLAVYFDKHKGIKATISYSMRGILVIPWLLSWTVAASIFQLILNPTGLINGYLKTLGLIAEPIPWLGSIQYAMVWIIIITVWKAFPFFFMLVYAAFMTVPNELYESAEIDGASNITKFWRITFPMISQTVMTLTMLDIIWLLRQYEIIALTTGGGPLGLTTTLTISIYRTAFEKFKFGLASSQGVVVLIIASIISFIYIRLYVRREEAL